MVALYIGVRVFLHVGQMAPIQPLVYSCSCGHQENQELVLAQADSETMGLGYNRLDPCDAEICRLEKLQI